MKLRRMLAFLLTTALMACACSAFAELIDSSEQYSDAPANSTHDNIVEITAQMQLPEHEEPVEFRMLEMLPTDITVDTVQDIYAFVDIQKLPPALYFPLLVQVQLDMILEPKGLEKEDLIMTEFMSMLPQISYDLADVEVEIEFDIDYFPGRPVVLVLGWEDDNEETGIHWVALDANIIRDHVVNYTIPAVILEKIHGRELLFSLLTVRPGKGASHEEEITPEPTFVPSISSGDSTDVSESTYSYESGEPIECEIVITDSTRRIDQELKLIQQHVLIDEKPISDYFLSHIEDHAELHLPDLYETEILIAYEMTCLEVIKYEEPYGDVAALFDFVTPYRDDMHLVSILGLPDPEDPDGPLLWTPLRTKCIDGYLEITFSSTVLPQMMEDTAILLVLSTPLPEEIFTGSTY